MDYDTGTKHTPGPWRVSRNTAYTGGECPEPDYDYWEILTPGGQHVCTVWELWPENEWTSQGETNANFIGAMPGLLDATLELRALLSGDGEYAICKKGKRRISSADALLLGAVLERIDAAIAQATNKDYNQ